MHTPTTSTRPTSQLDLVRDDAAARQRRAATFRFVHEQRPTRRPRRPMVTGIAAALLALGLAGGAAATVIDEPLPQGYEAGHADGWYSPDDAGGTVSTAEGSIRPASTPLRQGYEPGRPDGWFMPGTPGVQVAGISISRTSSDTVPPNVR